MDKRCILSGSIENLNTEMTVKIGENSIRVWISDEYLDQATPALVKQAVLKAQSEEDDKEAERQEILKKARELGLELAPVKSTAPYKVVDRNEPEDVPAIEHKPKLVNKKVARETTIKTPSIVEGLEPSKPGNRIIDGRTADARSIRANVTGSVQGFDSVVSGSSSEYVISSETKPSEDLKAGEIAEIAQAQGREGIPIAIPIRRKGKMGETRVKIVDTGGDVMLQRRFKDMSKMEEPYDFKKGYQVRTMSCTLCRGTGYAMNKQCPKCEGTGLIDVQV